MLATIITTAHTTKAFVSKKTDSFWTVLILKLISISITCKSESHKYLSAEFIINFVYDFSVTRTRLGDLKVKHLCNCIL